MGAVALARSLAMDMPRVARFATALQANDEMAADALVSSAVNAVVEKATEARTVAGRRRQLERSAAVFKQLGTQNLGDCPDLTWLSLSASGHEDLAVMTVWCQAVYNSLCSVVAQVAASKT